MSTAIEWTHPPGYKGETLNPIVAYHKETGARGWHCEHDGQGCLHCYAEDLNRKQWMGWGTGLKYTVPNRDKVRIELDERTLHKPLHWKAPRCIFWCSMTDIFGDWVTDEMLDRMFAVQALTPRHIHIVLSKRVMRMRRYWTTPGRKEMIEQMILRVMEEQCLKSFYLPWVDQPNVALPHVWMGISASTQKELDLMMPNFLEVPAAVRFLSLEPLVGPVSVARYLRQPWLCEYCYTTHYGDRFPGNWEFVMQAAICPTCLPKIDRDGGLSVVKCGAYATSPDPRPWKSPIQQVIVGMESGHPKDNPRPGHPDWPCQLRDECAVADIAFFFKQWGAWSPGSAADFDRNIILLNNGERLDYRTWRESMTDEQRANWDKLRGCAMHRSYGRKGGDGLLDGVRHHAWPIATTASLRGVSPKQSSAEDLRATSGMDRFAETARDDGGVGSRDTGKVGAL